MPNFVEQCATFYKEFALGEFQCQQKDFLLADVNQSLFLILARICGSELICVLQMFV